MTAQTTFLVADPHFSHVGMTKFLNASGRRERPWDTIEEHDDALVKNWNGVVKPNDKVYVLGDVAINRKGLNVLERLNGSKVLIKGNHDIFPLKDYTKHFRDIRAAHVLDKFVLTHIPIHPSSIERWLGNIHGHLHSEIVKLPNSRPDRRYFCVSMEQVGFTPIAFDEVKKQMEKYR